MFCSYKRCSPFILVTTRVFAAKGRAANEMEPGPSNSHYPISDTRTDEGEASHETHSLTGPGFGKGSSPRGRIWETEKYEDWKGKNRERERGWESEHMPPAISTSTFTDSKQKTEEGYQSSSRRSSRSAEMTLPVSKIREGGEDYSYSYSATSTATTVHRSQEDSSIASSSTSSKPSTTPTSISRAEENSSTPSVHRARNESVSGSSSALTMTHTFMFVFSLSSIFIRHSLEQTSNPY